MTLWGVPLDRVLNGAADALQESVAAHVADEAALGELHAVRDAIAGLSGQLDWRRGDIAASLEAAHDALSAARDRTTATTETRDSATPRVGPAGDQDSEFAATAAELAERLQERVLPHVTDHFASLQVRAGRELLLNLSTRAVKRPGASELVAELVHERAALADALERLYEDSESWRQAVLAAVWRTVRIDYDAESDRIRTGMFSKTGD
jgi:hypothetical protein